MKRTKFFKTVALIVIIAFLFQNIANADPDIIQATGHAVSDTLAPELSLSSEQGLELKGLMFLTCAAREALLQNIRSEYLEEFIGSSPDIPEGFIERIDFSATKISSEKLLIAYECESGRRTIIFSFLSARPSIDIAAEVPGRIILDDMVVEINMPEDNSTGLSPPEAADVTGSSEGNIARHEGKKVLRRSLWGRLLKKWDLVSEEGVNDVIRKYWKKGSPGKGCALLKERSAVNSILKEFSGIKSLSEKIGNIYIYDIGRDEFVPGMTTHYGIRTGSIHITKNEYERLRSLGVIHLAARVAHEVREIEMWRYNADKLIERKVIKGVGIAAAKYNEKWANGIRLWIRANSDNSGDGPAQRIGEFVHRKGLEAEISVLADGVENLKKELNSEEYYRSVAEMASRFQRGGIYRGMVEDPDISGQRPEGLYAELYETILKSLKHFKHEKAREHFADVLYARASLLYLRSKSGGIETSLKDRLLSSSEKAEMILFRIRELREIIKGIRILDDETALRMIAFIQDVEISLSEQDFTPNVNKAIVNAMVALQQQIENKNKMEWDLPRMFDPKDVLHAALDPGGLSALSDEGNTDTHVDGPILLGEIESYPVAFALKDQERPVTEPLSADAIIALLDGTGNWNRKGMLALSRRGTKSRSSGDLAGAKVPGSGSQDDLQAGVDAAESVRLSSRLIQPDVEVEYANIIARIDNEREFIERIDRARSSARQLISELSERVGLLPEEARQSKIFYGSPTGYFDVMDRGKDYPHVVDITIIVNGEKAFTRRNIPAARMSSIVSELPGVESINLIVAGTETIRNAFLEEGPVRIEAGSIINFEERSELQKIFIKAMREDIQVAGASLVNTSKDFEADMDRLEKAYLSLLITELGVKGRERESLEEEKGDLALNELPAEEKAGRSKLEEEIAAESALYSELRRREADNQNDIAGLIAEQKKVEAKKAEVYASNGGSPTSEDLQELRALARDFNSRVDKANKEREEITGGLIRSIEKLNAGQKRLRDIVESAKRAKEKRDGFNRKELSVRRDFQLLRKRIEDIQYRKGLVEGMVVNDRYRVMKKLGEGGFGEVYRVFDKDSNSEKAIKMLLGSIPSGQLKQAQLAFEKEKDSLRRLSEPPHMVQVPSVTGEGRYAGSPYFVMTLVKGLTLKEISKRLETKEISLSAREKLFLMYAVAKVLVAFHNAKEIHRDIKPENIMIPVDETGEIAFPWRKNKRKDRAGMNWLHHPEFEAFCRNVYIIDLGISLEGEVNDLGLTGDFRAKSMGSMDAGFSSKKAIGTPRYMAPEQHAETGVTSKTDVFAMGLIFFNLWSHRFPYGEDAKNSPYVMGISAMQAPRSLLCDVISEENESIRADRKATKDIELSIARERLEAIRPGLVEDLLTAGTGSKVIAELPDGTLRWNMRALGEKTLKSRLASIEALDEEERSMVFNLIYPFLPEADGYVEALINAMVEPSAGDRPTSLEIISEIEKYLTGRFDAMAYRPRGEIVREGLGVRAGKWVDNSKGALASILFVLVLALGGSVAFLYRLYRDAASERALAEEEQNRAKVEMVQVKRAKLEVEEKMVAAESAVRVLEKREKQLEAKKAEILRSKELIEKDKSSAEEARTANAQALKEKEKEVEEVRAALAKAAEQLVSAQRELTKLRESVTVVFEEARRKVMNHDLKAALEILSRKISWWGIDKENLQKYTQGYNDISNAMIDAGELKTALELENKRIVLLERAMNWHPAYTKEDKAVFSGAIFKAKMRRVELLRIINKDEAQKAIDALFKDKVIAGSKKWIDRVIIAKVEIMLDRAFSLTPGKIRDGILEDVLEAIKKLSPEETRDLYYGMYYVRTHNDSKAEKYFRDYSDYWQEQAAAEGIDPAERTKRSRKASYGLLLAAEAYTKSAGSAKKNINEKLLLSAKGKAASIIDDLIKDHSDQVAVLGWAYLMKGDLEGMQSDTQDARKAYETGLKLANSSKQKALILILSWRLKQKAEVKDLSGSLSDRGLLLNLYLNYAKDLVREEAANRKAAFERAKADAERQKLAEEEENRREEERKRKEKERQDRAASERRIKEEALAGIKGYKDARLKLEQLNKEIKDLRTKLKNETDDKKRTAMEYQIERALKKKGIVEGYMKAAPPASNPEKKNPEPAPEGKPKTEAKDPKQKGVGNVVDDAPDHRLVNAVIKCAYEEDMMSSESRHDLELYWIGDETHKDLKDVYNSLARPDIVWAEFRASCESDGLDEPAISDLYADGIRKLSNILGHAGLRNNRVFAVKGAPDLKVLIAHEAIELDLHQRKAASLSGSRKRREWYTFTNIEKIELIRRLREWEGYNAFAETAHAKAMMAAPVRSGIELVRDNGMSSYDFPDIVPYNDLSKIQAPIAGLVKPIVDVDILADKAACVSEVFEREMPSFRGQLTKALSKDDAGEGLILFADDIVDSSAVFDLKSVADMVGAEGSVLQKIVLYSADRTKAAVVSKVIMDSNANALVEIVMEEEVMEHYGRNEFCSRSVVDSVLRYVLNSRSGRIFARPDQIMGVVRGPLKEGEDAEAIREELRRSSIKVPVVAFSDSKYGHIYSIVEAVVKLAVMRSSGEGSANRWLYILPPIRRLSEALQTEYREYMTMLRALESAA